MRVFGWWPGGVDQRRETLLLVAQVAMISLSGRFLVVDMFLGEMDLGLFGITFLG